FVNYGSVHETSAPYGDGELFSNAMIRDKKQHARQHNAPLAGRCAVYRYNLKTLDFRAGLQLPTVSRKVFLTDTRSQELPVHGQLLRLQLTLVVVDAIQTHEHLVTITQGHLRKYRLLGRLRSLHTEYCLQDSRGHPFLSTASRFQNRPGLRLILRCRPLAQSFKLLTSQFLGLLGSLFGFQLLRSE